jgi:hypothetical protein
MCYIDNALLKHNKLSKNITLQLGHRGQQNEVCFSATQQAKYKAQDSSVDITGGW